MSGLKIGDSAPDFTLPTDNEGTINLASLLGKKVILYFYPKDNTPGCTTQACDLRDNIEDFSELDVKIIGISKDSPSSHTKFKAKYDLNFILASDENNNTCEDYGVWSEKSMYGKKFMGIERSTFLIDEKGKIEAMWRKVSPKDHVKLLKEKLA